MTGNLLGVSDGNGNALTFADAGILSSAGPRGPFDRDPQGRHHRRHRPAGQRASATSTTPRGDLVAVTDREGNTTRFVYRTRRPHYLDTGDRPAGPDRRRGPSTTTRAG